MDTYELIREFRKKQKLSQSEFSKKYHVPLSTLRKWEQKESKPSKYFVELINSETNNKDLITINNSDVFYSFDTKNQIVYDNKGTGIKVSYDITKVNTDNLILFLEQLYEDYYSIIDRFTKLCKEDEKQKGQILWRRLK